MCRSPYKRQLETSVALKEKTTNNETRIILSFTHNEVHSSDDDEDKGQDAECIYCSRLFSKDKKGGESGSGVPSIATFGIRPSICSKWEPRSVMHVRTLFSMFSGAERDAPILACYAYKAQLEKAQKPESKKPKAKRKLLRPVVTETKPKKSTKPECLYCKVLYSTSNEGWVSSVNGHITRALASLPVSAGGLVIRRAVDLAIPSFLASFHISLRLVEYLLPNGSCLDSDAAVQESMDRWTHLVGQDLPTLDMRGLQTVWDTPVITHLQTILQQSITNPIIKARYLAAFSKNQVHGSTPSLGRHIHHSSINDVILRSIISAEVPSVREPYGCCRSDGKRPDGMTLIPWKSDTFAPSNLPLSSTFAQGAVTRREIEKRRKYRELMKNFTFIPVTIETSGTWGIEGLNFIKEIGQRISRVSQNSKSTAFLIQRISITLQRGNVASILGTFPRGMDLEEIFHL
ncbi:hypothetical protein C0J52_25013 [Blattella germanica]|nr:hypothetical protein C0J52_25013 [Blattella germanica]